ncbi:hypothetical protein F5887DRAFT_1071217 [Amanita rubescens]|nr:hypothetical protein F5887DRAFT_1071217 [Amanita rubescens]
MAQHVHPRVLQWLRSNYPKPQLDPDWLSDCYNWLIHDKNLSPDSNFHSFIDTFEEQLLSSDLSDSMSHGTGLPTHIARPDTNTILTGPPILIRVAREERMRVDGTTENDGPDEGDIEVDEGPPPRYPRGMLKFNLTDVTRLGCKIQLKNVKIRNGIAWLEPDTIVLKGFFNKELEANQNLEFARDLRVRMGLPVEPIVQPAQMNASPPPLFLRSPLRDISPPPPDLPHNDDEILENRKRRIPSSSVTQTDSQTRPTQSDYRPIASSSRVASSSARAATTNTSPYFPSASQHWGKGFTDDKTIICAAFHH